MLLTERRTDWEFCFCLFDSLYFFSFFSFLLLIERRTDWVLCCCFLSFCLFVYLIACFFVVVVGGGK